MLFWVIFSSTFCFLLFRVDLSSRQTTLKKTFKESWKSKRLSRNDQNNSKTKYPLRRQWRHHQQRRRRHRQVRWWVNLSSLRSASRPFKKWPDFKKTTQAETTPIMTFTTTSLTTFSPSTCPISASWDSTRTLIDLRWPRLNHIRRKIPEKRIKIFSENFPLKFQLQFTRRKSVWKDLEVLGKKRWPRTLNPL